MKKKFVLFVAALLGSATVGFGMMYLAQNNENFAFFSGMGNSWIVLSFVVGMGLYLIYLLNHLTDKKPKPKVGAKDKKGNEVSQFFDSHWVTEKELKTQKQFLYNTWSTIRGAKDGVLIRSEMTKNQRDIDINMYNPIHTLIIGTTGTGKTHKYIIPTIQVLSSTKTKPSFVIADPKGELYKFNKHKLLAEGYDVKVFDLRDPYSSTRWNPLELIYNIFHKAHNIHDGVKTHVGINPVDLGLKVIAREYENEWYEYEGVAYPNKQTLESDLQSKRAELLDRAENDLKEISATLCPVENERDASWERGAQEFIFGTLMAMLEDSLNPSLGMTKDRFNFYNLTKICNHKDFNPNDPYTTLKQYYMGRDKFSKVPMLVSTAINNAPTTTKNFMGVVTSKLSIFNDGGMCFATSSNEMAFDSFADKPTALFIIIPDEKESRHPIATMMISQLYKQLVDISTRYHDKKLPRRVYLLLDEFANLPKIPKIDTMITVSRSRNIFFSLVVQNFSQLSARYGEDVAQTIKSNTPIKIFIGTDDQKTCEEFSKMCGDITLETTSISESKQKDGDKKDQSNKTTSLSATSRPLIYPDELSHVGKNDGTGDMIIKILSEFPIRTPSDPYWKTPLFDHVETQDEYVVARSLNEQEVAYSILDRNKIILKTTSPSGAGIPPRFNPTNF